MPAIINSDNGVVSGSAGLKTSGANDGILNIQTNGSTAMSVNASQQVTFNNGANLPNTFGFKNRIINGAMVIDQRNGGASVTPAEGQFTVDRWVSRLSASSKYSVQQNAGGVTPPTGYTNYLGVTSLSAYSLGASDFFGIQQNIEGFNIADLGWGASGGSPATLSFWVRSSLTGTFGCSLYNTSGSVSIPLTYTISSANTWQYVTVAIPNSLLAGTFASTTNGLGISVFFNLGCGTSQSGGTPGTWSGTFARAPSGAVSVVGTNGATFYITGVQLEKGSTATSFDFRDYGRELAMCQRYFEVLPIVNGDIDMNFNGFVIAASLADMQAKFAVTKRAAPTMTLNNVTQFRNGTSNITPSSGFSFTYSTTYGAIVRANHTATLSGGTGAALIGGTNASIFASIEL